MGMATDYDAPRKTDDDSDSIEALKERVPDKMSGQVDVDDADNPGSFELAGQDLSLVTYPMRVVKCGDTTLHRCRKAQLPELWILIMREWFRGIRMCTHHRSCR